MADLQMQHALQIQDDMYDSATLFRECGHTVMLQVMTHLSL